MDGDQRDFYFRQLKDWKGSVGVETLLPPGLAFYAGVCGRTLARAHARSGDRVAIATYLGKSDAFDKAIARFAAGYGDRNARDHQALLDAIEAGRVKAETGV
jgi:sugar/nucleoside kinase (ribokinase family)